MRKRWFNIFMGLFVLLFAGLWIAGCTDKTGLDGMKDKHNHDSTDETDVVAIAGGGSHNLEFKSDGTVWAWGNNNTGQLGDGTTIDSPAPIQVGGLTDVIAIAAGGYNSYRTESSHSLALKTDGTVWAWGSNSAGQLGDGTTTDSATPIQVIGLTDVAAVVAGGAHSIALKTDGTVWTWGYNIAGQLGVETTEKCEFDSIISYCSTTPVQVSGLTDVIAIAGGDFYTVALKSNGTVWVWGDSSSGQPGDGTTTKNTTPTQVSGLTGVIAIASGGHHTIALKRDGTVWAWGSNSVGQLGDGTRADSTTPIQVSGLTGVTAIAAGGNTGGNTGDRNWYMEHSIALKTDGTVWAWGDNEYGQLGVITTEICYISLGKEVVISTLCSTTPLQISDFTDVTTIAAGWEHSLALKTDGAVWAWGDNEHGQLGVATTETCGDYGVSFDCSTTPVQVRSKVPGTFSVSGTVSGLTGTLILQNNGGDDLKLTENGSFTFATELEDLAVYDIEFLTQPDGQSCKTMTINSGRINGADVTDISVICSRSFTDAAAIAGGIDHSIALKTDGTVWAWGSNRVGQLGAETTEMCFYNQFPCSTTPVEVSGITDVIAIESAGYIMAIGQTITLKNDGTVWAWGSNGYGQLGDGTRDDSATPVQVCASGETAPCDNFLANIAAIASGGDHTVALKNDGTVWVWGSNQYGQLGVTTTETCGYYSIPCSFTPLQVSGLTDVTAIAAGRDQTIALKTNGTVWVWGRNSVGQLGDGTTPVQVSGFMDVIAIAAGGDHTIVLKSNGTLWAWGKNNLGQLGDGTTIDRTTPVQVPGFTDVTAVEGGGSHTIALKTDGTVWAWGWNLYGQLGDGTRNDSATPVQVSGLTNITGIEGGGIHTLALKSDGTVWAWGFNRYGQLGDATTTDRYRPVQVLVTP